MGVVQPIHTNIDLALVSLPVDWPKIGFLAKFLLDNLFLINVIE